VPAGSKLTVNQIKNISRKRYHTQISGKKYPMPLLKKNKKEGFKVKKTMLENAINERQVVSYVDGQYTVRKGSNLYHAIMLAGYTPADIGQKIDIAIGARRQYRTMGYHMAIVAL
jgi:hypothetical protein